MEEDPAFYARFSKMLEDVIEEHRQQRLTDAEYLKQTRGIMESVVNRTDDDVPPILKGHEVARAFYGVLNDAIGPISGDGTTAKDVSADYGLKVDAIILKHRIVDWVLNRDVKNRMRNEIEDLLFDLDKKNGIKLDVNQIDDILDRCINIAETRYQL
jgi:type I restriction enzyme R subunit